MPRAFTPTPLRSLSKDDTNPQFALSQEKNLICHSEQAQCQHSLLWNISGKCTGESQIRGNSTENEKALRSSQITGPGAPVAKTPIHIRTRSSNQSSRPQQSSSCKKGMLLSTGSRAGLSCAGWRFGLDLKALSNINSSQTPICWCRMKSPLFQL